MPDTGEFEYSFVYECMLLHLWEWVHGRWHVCYGGELSIIIINKQ